MSKLDAQRAMRAARYDAARAASGPRGAADATVATPTGAGKAAAAKAPRTPRAKAGAAATDAPSDAVAVELCGHRSSIGGKSCRRPSGHTETTHRYT